MSLSQQDTHWPRLGALLLPAPTARWSRQGHCPQVPQAWRAPAEGADGRSSVTSKERARAIRGGGQRRLDWPREGVSSVATETAVVGAAGHPAGHPILPSLPVPLSWPTSAGPSSSGWVTRGVTARGEAARGRSRSQAGTVNAKERAARSSPVQLGASGACRPPECRAIGERRPGGQDMDRGWVCSGHSVRKAGWAGGHVEGWVGGQVGRWMGVLGDGWEVGWMGVWVGGWKVGGRMGGLGVWGSGGL